MVELKLLAGSIYLKHISYICVCFLYYNHQVHRAFVVTLYKIYIFKILVCFDRNSQYFVFFRYTSPSPGKPGQTQALFGVGNPGALPSVVGPSRFTPNQSPTNLYSKTPSVYRPT